MGLVYRCTECEGEMVLEAFHRGRRVRCPHCRGENDVPEGLEFRTATRETLRDANVGGWMLLGSLFSICVPCTPLAPFLWWYSTLRVQRAREAEREVDPALVWSRRLAVFGTLELFLLWGLFGVKSL